MGILSVSGMRLVVLEDQQCSSALGYLELFSPEAKEQSIWYPESDHLKLFWH